MKRIKIEAKLIDIISKIFKKEHRKEFKKNAHKMNMQFSIENLSNYRMSETLMISPNDMKRLFDNIADTFNLPQFKTEIMKIGEELMPSFSIRVLTDYIKNKQDNPPVKSFNFTVENNELVIDNGYLNVEHNSFSTTEHFWQAFDSWYKNNRKLLFTKPKKEKPVKQAKIKEPKLPKKAKKSKTEATASILQ